MAEKLRISGDGIEITAQFNPPEVSLDKGVDYQGVSSFLDNAEKQQFLRGKNEELSFELLFDATLDSSIDVKRKTDDLLKLTLIVSGKERPPIVTVVWGTSLSFKAVTRSVQRSFTLFDDGGRPLRATAKVTFVQVWTEAELSSQVGGQRSPHSRRWVVERGDTLTSIAGAAYNNPAAWRAIADANEKRVPDPRYLVPGTVLLIPPRPV